MYPSNQVGEFIAQANVRDIQHVNGEEVIYTTRSMKYAAIVNLTHLKKKIKDLTINTSV